MGSDKKQSNRSWLLALAGLFIVVVLSCVVALCSPEHPSTALKSERNSELASLHQFPPLQMADSIAMPKTTASYEDKTPKDVYYFALDSLGQPTDEVVYEAHYYPDNSKYFEGNISNKEREGLWYAYHKNGNVQTMAHYVQGKEQGQYTVYYENGNVMYTGKYDNGERVGIWNFYDPEEQLMRTIDYSVNPPKVETIQ
ncbi:MAG: hypothetical protein J6T59_07445 [Bacteroidales bacterium]|nr:hypothetical protein [Bacteroidales bacterium]